jgi:hypothetical protein
MMKKKTLTKWNHTAVWYLPRAHTQAERHPDQARRHQIQTQSGKHPPKASQASPAASVQASIAVSGQSPIIIPMPRSSNRRPIGDSLAVLRELDEEGHEEPHRPPHVRRHVHLQGANGRERAAISPRESRALLG